MNKPIEIKYCKSTALWMMAMLVFMVFITILAGINYFSGIIIFVIYLIFTSFKTGIFRENAVVFKYPFRLFKRFVTFDYHLIESIEVRSGNVRKGRLIILRYRGKTKIRKMLLDYPSNKTWEELSDFLQAKNVKVL